MVLGLACVACLGGLQAGCREAPVAIVVPPLTAPLDAGRLPDGGGRLPEWAVPCASGDECDDGIDCTVDRCGRAGYCQFRRDNGRCSDGDFCNGQEVCDPLEGCLAPLRPRSCSDDDVCTLDSCDNQAGLCLHRPRDSDGDGEVDVHCPGGFDCDDLDPSVGSERPELCADGVDNDCDRRVDEDECGGPDYDTCDGAPLVELSPGDAPRTVELSLAGAGRDYAIECDAAATRDVAVRLDLPVAADVDIRATGVLPGGGRETASLSLRGGDCGSGSAIECARGFPASVRRRGLSAGSYFLVIDSQGADRVAVDIAAFEPSEVPANTTCEVAAQIEFGEGGRAASVSDFVDVSDDYLPVCAASEGEAPAQPDLVYRYTLQASSDVSLLLSSPGGEPMTLSVRSVCEAAESTLACRIGAPVIARLHEQPAGDYYVLVESPSYREVDFALEVIVEEPSSPPEGDTCEVAADLPLSTTVAGSLMGKQPAVPASCHEDFLASDVVYRVVLEERADLELVADASGAPLRMAVQAACGEPMQELRCQRGDPVGVTLRDLAAGSYYVAIDGPVAADFGLRATPRPPTTPTAVVDNDACEGAFTLPASGGVFSGDTADYLDDYDGCAGAELPDVVYRLVLDEESLVTVRLEADFDAVLYRFAGVCGGVVGACNDDDGDGTGDSELQGVLAPGEHYFVVDGRQGGTPGPYQLEVILD